jgi:hypothetical protein
MAKAKNNIRKRKQPMKPNRPLNPQRIKFMGRIRGPFFKQSLLQGILKHEMVESL